MKPQIPNYEDGKNFSLCIRQRGRSNRVSCFSIKVKQPKDRESFKKYSQPRIAHVLQVKLQSLLIKRTHLAKQIPWSGLH